MATLNMWLDLCIPLSIKRGAYLICIFFFFEGARQIRTVEQIDGVISAQIPDPNLHPQLHSAVTKYMLHGPCSPQRCIENNVCKKHFPKVHTPHTIIKEDGYPNYACPNNGRTVRKGQDIFDNRHMVPHPRELLV